MRLAFSDEGAQLELVVGEHLVGQTTAVAIKRHGVMLAFTDVAAHEDITGAIK